MSPSQNGVTTLEGMVLEQEDIEERIETLRELMKDDEHVRNLRQDDAYLLRFLHCCDFDVDAAYKRMQSYYDLLVTYPDWFSCDSPASFKRFLDQDIRILTPEKDKDGRPIYICKIGNIDTSITTLKDVVHLDQTYLELIMDEPQTQEKGLCVVLDCEGYSWKIFKWLTPHNMRVSSKLMDIYPVKQYKVHVVNTSALVNASVKIMWPFLSQRIKDMVIFHFGNYDSLHNHVSPEVLPSEYGGTASLDYQKCYNALYSKNNEISEKLKHHRVKKV